MNDKTPQVETQEVTTAAAELSKIFMGFLLFINAIIEMAEE